MKSILWVLIFLFLDYVSIRMFPSLHKARKKLRVMLILGCWMAAVAWGAWMLHKAAGSFASTAILDLGNDLSQEQREDIARILRQIDHDAWKAAFLGPFSAIYVVPRFKL